MSKKTLIEQARGLYRHCSNVEEMVRTRAFEAQLIFRKDQREFIYWSPMRYAPFAASGILARWVKALEEDKGNPFDTLWTMEIAFGEAYCRVCDILLVADQRGVTCFTWLHKWVLRKFARWLQRRYFFYGWLREKRNENLDD